MANFVSVAPELWRVNPFESIGRKGMLITATKEDGTYNTMTASWGGVGVLWGKNVCMLYIRPQRYTFEFAEATDLFTLSFFEDKYADALKLCGTKSGRDIDKAKEAGLTPCRHKDSGIYFAEAKHVIIARKLYEDDLKKECFTEDSPLVHYAKNDFHRMYICEIEGILTKIS